MCGICYPGFYAAMGLIDAHPTLVAASPQAPIADWFVGDDFHHNGALFLPHAFNFFVNFGRPRPEPTTRWPPRDAKAVDLFLVAKGRLSRSAPAEAADAFDEYVSDPAKPVPFIEDTNIGMTREYMVVQVQSSWFPLVNLNPQTFVNINEATEAAYQKATQRVWRTAAAPSRVRLSVMP